MSVNFKYLSVKNYVIITAGGSGSRMKSDLPKQFIEIEGKSILHRTLERFLSCPGLNPEIILVMNPEYRDCWLRYCEEKKFIFPHIVCPGGLTRFHSVKNGLKYVREEDACVAVHDAVRPFVNEELISGLFTMAREYEAVIPVVDIADSLRKKDSDSGSVIIDRNGMVAVQTPQVFKASLLKAAYGRPYRVEYTDDASVVEAYGHGIHLADGLSFNIKITRPADLEIARALVNVQYCSMR